MAVDRAARNMAMDAAAHGGGTAPVDTYTKSETDALLEQKADKSEVTESVTASIAQFVANAPEDFDTLKEMSDWIASHEDSAAAMHSVILQNAEDIVETNVLLGTKPGVKSSSAENAEVFQAETTATSKARTMLRTQPENLLTSSATVHQARAPMRPL